MTRLTLEEILSLENHEGLLDVVPKASAASSDESRMLNDFDELNRFIDVNCREPGQTQDSKPSVKERVLALRLKSYRESLSLPASLRDADRHNLLPTIPVGENAPSSLDDILALDDDLLVSPREDLFRMRHARAAAAKPDRVSERRPCREFDQFKPLFDACVADLVAGRRKSLRFANEQEVRAGEFFILNGVMVYVAEVNDPHVRNKKKNARLRLIFENGTEGENLLRSLATELYKDPNGRRISSVEFGPLFESENSVSPDRIAGTIYVLRSLSTNPQIDRIRNQLVKIGVTSGSIEDRIKTCHNDPTFLFAPVKLVKTYEAINVAPTKLENLIHRFFGESRLDIELPDRFGKPYRPREWFVIPLDAIDQAVRMMLDGSILDHRYNAEQGVIEKR